jgi:hypothetical protein
MGIKEIYEKYNTSLEDCFLKETSKVDDFEKEIGELLKQMYSHPNPNIIRMATIFNSILTHRHQTFMISRRILVKLFASETNSCYKSINDREYNILIYKMLKHGDFIRLREPSNETPNNLKAGVYKTIEPDIIRILHTLHGVDYFKLQEEAVIKLYDEPNKNPEDFSKGWLMRKIESLTPEEKQKYREMKR